jgi:hypothetical protein
MNSVATRSSRRKPFAQRTLDVLVAEGLQPTYVRQAPPFEMFVFHHKGDRFYVQLDKRDDDFLQLSLAYALPAPRPVELAALRAAHDLQGSSKLVKIFLGRDLEFVEFQAPLLLGGHRLRPKLLADCMSLLRSVAEAFRMSLLIATTPVAHA